MSVLLTVLVAWFAWVLVVHVIWWDVRRGPDGEPVTYALWRSVAIYSRIVHRVRYEGLEHVPRTNQPGGMVVVSNHTAGIDPLLIQSGVRFHVRWMMASDMMEDGLGWLWRQQRMIPVDRDGHDSGPAREAIRHVRGGGVVGIFPEGGISKPRGRVRPFSDGVGLIASRGRAPVLLCWVSGTPESDSAFGSLRRTSRSRVVFIDRFEVPRDASPAEITADLRRRIAEASGWPLDDEPLASSARS